LFGGTIFGGGTYVGGTPLFLASAVGDVEVIRLLVANGADFQLTTRDGTTPLMAAAGISIIEAETSTSEERLLSAVQCLLELGADANATNNEGNTALHATAFVGFNEIASS